MSDSNHLLKFKVLVVVGVFAKKGHISKTDGATSRANIEITSKYFSVRIGLFRAACIY